MTGSRVWRPELTITCPKPFEPKELLLQDQRHSAPGPATGTPKHMAHRRCCIWGQYVTIWSGAELMAVARNPIRLTATEAAADAHFLGDICK